jgi:hypothetical protein
MPVPKTGALPLGDTPTALLVYHNLFGFIQLFMTQYLVLHVTAWYTTNI